MSFLRSRIARIAVPVAVAGAVAAGVTTAVAAIDDSGVRGRFAIDDFLLPAVPTGGRVSQSVAGLWFGEHPHRFAKVAGADWLDIDDDGVVTGTAPSNAPGVPATITVRVGDKSTGHTLTVDVPVTQAGQPARLEVASWNLGSSGQGTSSTALTRQIQAIVANNIQVLGLQGTGGTAAAQLAQALGWHSYQSDGDLGILSAYPISDVTAATAGIPAVGATISVNGRAVRVWTTHLDEADYGPYRACFDGAADLAAHERGTARYADATAVRTAMGADLAGASSTPVVLLGDLASPSAADWTAATSTMHCAAGPVAWPVPDVFTGAGLIDSYRHLKADPVASPGVTWSPLIKRHAGSTEPEPQDRVDYVDYAGPLSVLGSESLYTGGVGARTGDVVSDWPSDHAAAVTLFQLPAGAAPQASTAGTALTPASTPSSTPSTGGKTVAGAATTPKPAAKPTSKPAAKPKPKPKPAHKPLVKLTTHRPAISGAVKAGRTVRVRTGRWSPHTVFSYQWYVDGKALRGATHPSLVLLRKYAGHRLTVKVVGRKAGFRTASVTSVRKKVAR